MGTHPIHHSQLRPERINPIKKELTPETYAEKDISAKRSIESPELARPIIETDLPSVAVAFNDDQDALILKPPAYLAKHRKKTYFSTVPHSPWSVTRRHPRDVTRGVG
ncbi:hypothetical protein D9756_007530 [Leucocoprinus leucothites]|uniref:Uncharacterized protein n=1 Tax=Leucocoprinus leucothites TaxID=201217 RepID=A0A8H5D1Q5_9AGAR|nr:hypothetical protein D9756_007530 [Leucoagaricus leucothites]